MGQSVLEGKCLGRVGLLLIASGMETKMIFKTFWHSSTKYLQYNDKLAFSGHFTFIFSGILDERFVCRALQFSLYFEVLMSG